MDFLKKAGLEHFTGKKASGDKTAASSSTARKPDSVDKAIDLVQEHVLKQGSQKNESAAEQAKDDKIKTGVKSLYKMATGKNL